MPPNQSARLFFCIRITPPKIFGALLLLPDEPPPQAPASSASAARELMKSSRRLIAFLLNVQSFRASVMSSPDRRAFIRPPFARAARVAAQPRGREQSRARSQPLHAEH